MDRQAAIIPGVLFCVGLAACGGPDTERQIGFVEFMGQPVSIEVPSTVKAGEGFPVTVTTWGGGCLMKGRGRTAIARIAEGYEVTPYDRYVLDEVCPAVILREAHQAWLAFDRAGTKDVVVRGKRYAGSGGPEETVRLHHAVEVRAD